MLPDREAQQFILKTLAEFYPGPPPFGTFSKLEEAVGGEEKINCNMIYLESHGLIHSGLCRVNEGFTLNEADIFLTKDGVDFLLNDGGLSAILNTVTVKFHDESLSKLSAFIQNSSLSHQDKTGYVAKLKELPAETTKHIVLKLMEIGLEKGGKIALQLIRNSLGFD